MHVNRAAEEKSLTSFSKVSVAVEKKKKSVTESEEMIELIYFYMTENSRCSSAAARKEDGETEVFFS